jgi:hypothetical protein
VTTEAPISVFRVPSTIRLVGILDIEVSSG